MFKILISGTNEFLSDAYGNVLLMDFAKATRIADSNPSIYIIIGENW